MAQERRQPITLTREELYQRVWEAPMQHLAASLGITGTGLAKICRRMEVPCPPRGYWNKKAAGKPVVQYRLQEAKSRVPGTVTIAPTWQPTPKPEVPLRIQQQAEEVATKATILVSEKLTRPHRIVAGWIEANRRHKRETRGELSRYFGSRLASPEFTPLDHRKHRILDALFKAIERIGGSVQERDYRLHAKMNGHEIEFSLTEKQRQYRRELTQAERKEALRWGRDQKWTQIKEPTGKLQLSIKSYWLGGLKTDWLETEEKPMEAILPEIVGTFAAAGTILEEREKERLAAEIRRQEQARIAYEEEQRKKRDRNRWRRFVQLARMQEEADLARAFLARIQSMERPTEEMPVGDRSLSEWIAWAEDKIADQDVAVQGAKAVFDDIASIDAGIYRD